MKRILFIVGMFITESIAPELYFFFWKKYFVSEFSAQNGKLEYENFTFLINFLFLNI